MGLRDPGRAEQLGKAGQNWEQQVNPSRSKQRGQRAAGMLPAREEYMMHRGKGSELLYSFNSWVSITDELKPPQKGTRLHLTCHKPSSSDGSSQKGAEGCGGR